MHPNVRNPDGRNGILVRPVGWGCSNEHRQVRKASIQKLSFPYPYRDGQRRLVAATYRTMINGEQLFIQAPIGIGKTLSTVFPAVWAVGEDYADKIFYLTAKTITRTAAVSAFDILREKGLQASIKLGRVPRP